METHSFWNWFSYKSKLLLPLVSFYLATDSFLCNFLLFIKWFLCSDVNGDFDLYLDDLGTAFSVELVLFYECSEFPRPSLYLFLNRGALEAPILFLDLKMASKSILNASE